MHCTSYVNPFQGNGEIKPEKPEFPANRWKMIKALTGNTTPAATLPFGKYSCLAYSGAYSSGYGTHMANYGGQIEKLFPEKRFIGLSHFHHSGAGGIGTYYNYALTVPFYGDTPDFIPHIIQNEEAHPGYYCVEIQDIRAEATVNRYGVHHRYAFTQGKGNLFVDFSNNGLYAPKFRGAAEGTLIALDEQTVLGEMVLSKLKLWFCVRCAGGKLACFMKNREKYDLNPLEAGVEDTRLGCLFRTENTAEITLTVSAVSGEHARQLLEKDTQDFDATRQAAEAVWEEYLSKIEIETDSQREREIFYSNFYHTLVKPCDNTNEAFLFDNMNGEFVTDIVTMWDIYKTQLPLLFTLYPEISQKIVKTLQRYAETYGKFPHCVLLSHNLSIEAKQARMLAEYAICDAYYRGIPADYEKLLALCDVDGEKWDMCLTQPTEYASHILDVAEAYNALSLVAEKMGDDSRAKVYGEKGKHIVNAFGPDGMMREDSLYYEGNRFNYSFRPVQDMRTRISLAGLENIQAAAMEFFGFTDNTQGECRFEGYNNETDMETPYFLHCIGRRDLLGSVLKTGMDAMFTTGNGGIPGNADSGGLTACYLWNVIGIFPIAGFDRMIVGFPRYKRVTLHLPKGDFVIEHLDTPGEMGAWLNGKKLENFEFCASQMLSGGLLQIRNEKRS